MTHNSRSRSRVSSRSRARARSRSLTRGDRRHNTNSENRERNMSRGHRSTHACTHNQRSRRSSNERKPARRSPLRSRNNTRSSENRRYNDWRIQESRNVNKSFGQMSTTMMTASAQPEPSFFKDIYQMTGKRLHVETCLRLDNLVRQHKLELSDLNKPVFVNSMQFLNEKNMEKFDRIINDPTVLTRTGKLDVFQLTKHFSQENILDQNTIINLLTNSSPYFQNLLSKNYHTEAATATANAAEAPNAHRPIVFDNREGKSDENNKENLRESEEAVECELEIRTPESQRITFDVNELLEKRGYTTKYTDGNLTIKRKDYKPLKYDENDDENDDDKTYGIKLKNTDFGKTLSVKGGPCERGIELELLSLFEKHGGRVNEMSVLDSGARVLVMMSSRDELRKALKHINGYKIRPNHELTVRESLTRTRLHLRDLPDNMHVLKIKKILTPHLKGIRLIEMRPVNTLYVKINYCWIDFFNAEFASIAMSKLEEKGDKWFGRQPYVEWALQSTMLCVADFDSNVKTEKLAATFGEYGPLVSVERNRANFALVEFESQIDAALARDDLNNMMLEHSRINVWPAAKSGFIVNTINRESKYSTAASSPTKKTQDISATSGRESAARKPLGAITNDSSLYSDSRSKRSQSPKCSRACNCHHSSDSPPKKRRY